LRFAGTTYGLLQLNDRRKGQFTPKLIDLLERLADSIATALAQRQAQGALRESEAKFRAIASHTPDHILMQDRELRYTFVVNPQLGLTEADMIGKTEQDFLAPDDAEKLITAKRKVMETGQPLPLTISLKNRNGGEDTFEGSYIPKMDADGRVDGIIGYFRNITERKRTETKLRENEERYQSLVRTSLDGFWAVDMEGRLLEVNDAYCAMSGYSRQALLSMRITDLEYKETPEQTRAHLERVFVRGWDCFESQHRRADGTILEVQISSVHLASQNIILCFINDITDRKRSEQVLESAKDYAENLIQTANTMVIGMDSSGVVQVFNDAAEKITGYTRREIEGRNWFEVIVPRDRYPQVWKEFERLQSGGLPKNFENPILTKSGQERYIAWQNNEVFEQGRVVGTISFGMDITERKRAEEKLVEYQAELRSLLSRISIAEEQERKRIAEHLHDHLGQSMVLAKMKLDALGRADLPPAAGAAVRQIGKTVGDLIRTTQSITYDLSNPVLYERGLVAAIQEWIQEEYTPKYAVRVSFRNATRKLDLPAEQLVFVYRTVRELLINVAKHAQTQIAAVTIQRRHGRVRITVLDDGAGFDPDKSPDRFGSQSHYGLFSIRERMDYLGGTMTIESHSGQGTCVTLILPEPTPTNRSTSHDDSNSAGG
jgi:PAS domain S-box-containing protein